MYLAGNLQIMQCTNTLYLAPLPTDTALSEPEHLPTRHTRTVDDTLGLGTGLYAHHVQNYEDRRMLYALRNWYSVTNRIDRALQTMPLLRIKPERSWVDYVLSATWSVS